MEDGDSDSESDADSEMARAGYGTARESDGLFGRCRPKRHSGIGNRIPRFPGFGGDFPVPGSRFPIGRESGVGKRAVSRLGRDRESGSRGRGISLVWLRGFFCLFQVLSTVTPLPTSSLSKSGKPAHLRKTTNFMKTLNRGPASPEPRTSIAAKRY